MRAEALRSAIYGCAVSRPSLLSLRWTLARRHPSGRTLPAMLVRIDAEDVELIGEGIETTMAGMVATGGSRGEV